MNHCRTSIRKRAFTLIELLVVIAIIAILAAILFPVFAQAKRAAKITVSLSNMKQLSLAARMYASDSDDVNAMTVQAIMNSSGWIDPSNYIAWPQLIYPYTKNAQICWHGLNPMPNSPTTTPDGNPFKVQYTAVNPAASDSWGWWTQYATIGPNAVALNGWNGNIFPRPDSLYIDQAATGIYVTRTDPVHPGFGTLDWNPYYETCIDSPTDNGWFYNYWAYQQHANSQVVGFADGHAGKKHGDLWTIDPGCSGFWENVASWSALANKKSFNYFYAIYLDGKYTNPQ